MSCIKAQTTSMAHLNSKIHLRAPGGLRRKMMIMIEFINYDDLPKELKKFLNRTQTRRLSEFMNGNPN